MFRVSAAVLGDPCLTPRKMRLVKNDLGRPQVRMFSRRASSLDPNRRRGPSLRFSSPTAEQARLNKRATRSLLRLRRWNRVCPSNARMFNFNFGSRRSGK